ncbi:MAG: fibrillarin-like rRNA/tRNA 2'-O-methyltransferase [Methanobacteriota archaeon]
MPGMKQSRFGGVYTDGSRQFTLNRDPGQRVYGEDLATTDGAEYRAWDPRRSKLAAALLNGLESFPFTASSRVLYLGAASGTTASHVSDIATDGQVFCVEIASRPFRDLVALCERRKNMHPILSDASNPGSYAPIVQSVDVAYQDISQKDQVGILHKNLDALPPSTGMAILMVKARSIDVSANPAKIFARVEGQLVERGYEVEERIDLAPYEKDHEAMVVSIKDD